MHSPETYHLNTFSTPKNPLHISSYTYITKLSKKKIKHFLQLTMVPMHIFLFDKKQTCINQKNTSTSKKEEISSWITKYIKTYTKRSPIPKLYPICTQVYIQSYTSPMHIFIWPNNVICHPNIHIQCNWIQIWNSSLWGSEDHCHAKYAS